eukprot:TRINITY_DN12591_c0_g1_i1.p1 TRINITY_DN12591_c0_g1~~TRINITY_DN12591_c0_g1_i1.p1  ORF type:complete len:158 (-),score=31.95 TRINITY_DN12591_c0_g1_i1:34-507(-)
MKISWMLLYVFLHSTKQKPETKIILHLHGIDIDGSNEEKESGYRAEAEPFSQPGGGFGCECRDDRSDCPEFCWVDCRSDCMDLYWFGPTNMNHSCPSSLACRTGKALEETTDENGKVGGNELSEVPSLEETTVENAKVGGNEPSEVPSLDFVPGIQI